MRKTLVIGVDGADSRIIKSLVKRGKLNNFKNLMDQGCFGKLKSTIPAITIPAWPAMFSGKNAGKLGAVGFSRLERDYRLKVFTSTHWKKDMLWSLLGEKGLRTGLLNVPGTNPVYKINGFVVGSDFGSFQTYPDDLGIKMDNKPLEKIVTNFKRLKAEKHNLKERTRVAVELIKGEDWQLFIWVIRLTDIAMHLSGRKAIEEAYILTDKYIAPVLKMAVKNKWNLFVVSDHGARKVKKNFNINTFLKKIAYLKFGKEDKSLKIARILTKYKLKPFLMAGYRFLSKITNRFSHFDPESISVDIKWDETKAFTLTDTTSNFMGIWFHSKKNFDQGIISSEKEEEAIKQDLINRLMQFKDGEIPVVKNVWRKEKLYPHSSRYIPDLFVETEENYAPDFRAYDKVITDNEKYIHDPYGIFIASGPDIKNEQELKNLQIIDITPTILHMLDLPLSTDMDGRVLKEIFRSESEPLARKVRYEESTMNGGEEFSSSSEEEIIKKRLKVLGYLG